jgi:hypothetical protein
MLIPGMLPSVQQIAGDKATHCRMLPFSGSSSGIHVAKHGQVRAARSIRLAIMVLGTLCRALNVSRATLNDLVWLHDAMAPSAWERKCYSSGFFVSMPSLYAL